MRARAVTHTSPMVTALVLSQLCGPVARAGQEDAAPATSPAPAVQAPQEERGDRNELRLGSVAMDVPASMHRRLGPLTTYLSETIGIPVTLKLAPNMTAAIAGIADGSVDIAYLTPVAYLRAHDEGKARLVVKTITDGEGSFRLMIVVADKSPIQKVEDLAGKSFAFGDKAAVLQRAVVVGAGMPLERLAEKSFLGHYDNIALGILTGDFDAGIVKDTTAVKLKSRGIRVVHASPPLPPFNFSVSAKVDDALHKKLLDAFLALDPKNPKHRAVIEALDPSYDGFAVASDSEYDVVRKLIAPFADDG